MKLFVNNKTLSFGGNSVVTNEQGEQVYNVKGKWVIFSPTHKKKIYDMNKNLLFKVRTKFFNWWLPKAFIFDANGEKIAKVKPASIKSEYYIEGYKDEITLVKNGAFKFDFDVVKNEQPFARIYAEFSVVNDKYVIEGNEEDMPFLVALTIALDNIKDKTRR